MRILLIEDESDIIRFLQPSLESESFVVDVATDGAEGSRQARLNEYDLIILDNMLPKKNGEQVCREIRTAGNTVPILMLSVMGDPHQKVNLLNAGADDYLSKPFSTSELVARIHALLRRPHILQSDIITIGPIVLNRPLHTVTVAKKEVYLTRKEFILLEYLMKNKNVALSRAMIMEHVWDSNTDPFSNTIESHIVSLRKKVDRDSRYIQTIPGVGYKMSNGKI
jgi:DNA-binding response OmpR family regulator